MVSYAYKGVDRKGSKIEGQISAASLDEAEKKLSLQDISIHVLMPAAGAKGFKKVEIVDTRSKLIRKKVSPQDSADILSNLAIMASTNGTPVSAMIARLLKISAES